MSFSALRRMVGSEAEIIAKLLRSRGGDRVSRGQARGLLLRAFEFAEAEIETERGGDGPGERDGGEAEVAGILRILHELDTARLALSGLSPRGLRPIREVWIRRPWPEQFRLPRTARGTLSLVAVVQGRGALPMGISEVRLAWFEERCSAADPGLLRPMQAQDIRGAGRGQRSLSSDLELIRKRGRSRFS